MLEGEIGRKKIKERVRVREIDPGGERKKS